MPLSSEAVIGIILLLVIAAPVAIYIGSTVIASAPTFPSSTPTSYAEDAFQMEKGASDTFELGITLAKVLVILATASIIITLLGQVGLIPRFFGNRGESSDEPTAPPEPQVQTHNIPQWRTSAATPVQQQPQAQSTESYSNPFADEKLPESHYHNRFEAILEDESELEVAKKSK